MKIYNNVVCIRIIFHDFIYPTNDVPYRIDLCSPVYNVLFLDESYCTNITCEVNIAVSTMASFIHAAGAAAFTASAAALFKMNTFYNRYRRGVGQETAANLYSIGNSLCCVKEMDAVVFIVCVYCIKL